MDEHARLIERLLDDVRDLASDIKELSVSTARHEEILRDRSSVITSSLERITLLEAAGKDLERRADDHGRKVASLQLAFDSVMKARRDAEAEAEHQKPPAPPDWKQNPLIWAIAALGLIAAYLAFLAFGGEPGAVLEHLPG